MEKLLVNQLLENNENQLFDFYQDLSDDFDRHSAQHPAGYADNLHYFNFLPVFWPFITNFPVKSDDILISTFPKSGTTWMQQIVYLIMTQDFDCQVPITVRFPFLELPVPMKQSTLITLAKQMDRPRLMKTHLPASLLPKQWRNGKLIYIYRNAKDCAVSFYHHQKRYTNGKYQHGFEHYATDFINGKVTCGAYHTHLRGYHDIYQKDPDSMLFLRYEDMKQDPKGIVLKTARFLGKLDCLSDWTIDRIVTASSFESMRQNNSVNHRWMPIDSSLPDHMRKGVVGDWKNYFTNKQLLEDFENYIHENLPKSLISNSNND